MKHILILIVVWSLCLVMPAYATAPEPTEEQTKLVKYVTALVGNTAEKNSCQAFVYNSLHNCFGIDNTKQACCATKAWQGYGVSSSRTNIPLGSVVYFSGSTVTDTDVCNQDAGHAGIYVGNDEIIHIWNSQVKLTTINYVISKGFQYVGWGWQGGRSLRIDKPSINITSYPTTLNQGQSFNLAGSINANDASTEITGYITMESGKVLQSSTLQKTTSSNFNIAYSNVNNQLLFNKLLPGTYFLNITAKNAKGTATFSKRFTVKSTTAATNNAPVINMTSYPSEIKVGEYYDLKGAINAVGFSTEIKGYILNSNGKVLQSSTLQKTTSSDFNIQSSKINNQLLFNKLLPGTYSLKITAKNIKGATTFIEKFTVINKDDAKKPVINMTSYPSEINVGNYYDLKGSVNANGFSTEVKGYIINSSGKVVQSSTLQKTTSSNFNIRYSNVNNQLLFDKLSRGTYTLKITAENEKGTSTFTSQFTVK